MPPLGPQKLLCFVWLVSWLTIPGCANVTFHSDAALTQKSGLKFYNSKPYLMVSYTGAKDNPVKIDIISLPDLEHPTYAIYHPGWGSHNFTLAQNTNSTLSSYGQTADSKGPETLNAIAGLLTSATGGVGAVANAMHTLQNQSEQLPAVDLALRNAVTVLQDISNKPSTQVTPFEQKQVQLAGFAQDLNQIREKLSKGDPNQREALEKIATDIGNAKLPTPGDVAIAQSINDALDQAKNSIDKALKALSDVGQKPKEKPDFKLFEIRMENGVTKLVPVNAEVAEKIVRQSTTIHK